MGGSGYEGWDRVYRETPLEALPWELGRPRQLLVELVEGGRVKPGKALDICCGAGTNAVYLAQKGFTVTGVDISPTAVGVAREKAEMAEVKIRFLVKNFLNLPFRDEEFDFVFDMGCFHHVHPQDRPAYINGVNRVLREGGLYFLVCFSYRNGVAWNHFTRNQLIRYFSDYFKIENVRHISSLERDNVVRYFYAVLMEK